MVLLESDIRGDTIKELLQSGWPVQYMYHSDGFYPIARRCEWTVWEPVDNVATLAVGEIVSAEPSEGRLLVMVIHGIDIHGWSLGDMSDPPRMYGYCEADGIHGRLTDVFD